MGIVKNIKVPTGNILVVEGENGLIECLSLGDYGQENNLKADFLGLTNEVNGVQHGKLLGIDEKWVVTVSTQYGCAQGCSFCDAPKATSFACEEGVKNASLEDILTQVRAAISLHPEITHTKRLNLHYARMGEPLMNMQNVCASAEVLACTFKYYHQWGFHPVVSTIVPRGLPTKEAVAMLKKWCDIKNIMLDGDAGLQISINSTDDEWRKVNMPNACTLNEIAAICWVLPMPAGRKYTLNFAILKDTVIDAERLMGLFNPEHWLVKLTPMHDTHACHASGMNIPEAYESYAPYKHHEEALKAVGFDVIVFVPSKEEDDSLITCGNAILSGTRPRTEFTEE